ncbi:MAG TPA: glycoside hydrolase domain-containing protein, partial [Chitinophagaceae bacterium]|nr:glycoside hydrolase domain-containing protein [Chitinophagaceae bacterium]
MKKALLFFLLFTYQKNCFSQELAYTNCNNCWNPDSLGNHRAVLELDSAGPYAKAVIDWRRRDRNPQSKRIIVEDAQTHQRIMNATSVTLNRESGEIYFEPVSGAGTYYVYYMPYKNEGRSNYPRGIYLKPDTTASPQWLRGLNGIKNMPVAKVKEMQSIDSFNTFYPMEVIATKKETEKLIAANSASPFVVFPEDRLHSIRMKYDLPQRWIEKGPSDEFNDDALRGENFAFQLGVYALKDLDDVKINFTDLTSSSGNTISAKNIFCINTGGIGYDGISFEKKLSIPQYTVQPVWCGINVPEDAASGIYSCTATLTAAGASKEIRISLTVSNEIARNGGVDEPWKMTRLRWLNSVMAQQNTVIAPYTPLVVTGKTISLLGRKFIIGNDGLPGQVQTFFTPEMTSMTAKPNNILAAPFQFIAENFAGIEKWKNEGTVFTEKSPGTVKWSAVSTSPSFQMEVNASLEFDGFVSYAVKIIAAKDITVRDIRMEIPMTPASAKYMMGLGQKGGYRPE